MPLKSDTCPICGLDESSLGVYRDFIHFIPGTNSPCLNWSFWSPEMSKSYAEMDRVMEDSIDKRWRDYALEIR